MALIADNKVMVGTRRLVVAPHAPTTMRTMPNPSAATSPAQTSDSRSALLQRRLLPRLCFMALRNQVIVTRTPDSPVHSGYNLPLVCGGSETVLPYPINHIP